MMIVKHLAEEKFIKMDKELLKLSQEAYYLYAHYCNQHPSKDPNDGYMQEVTDIKHKKFFYAKKELRDNGYIFPEQVGKKEYVYHIGKSAVIKAKSKK